MNNLQQWKTQVRDADYRTKQEQRHQKQMQTILDKVNKPLLVKDSTSKYCPLCLEEGRKVVRYREYLLIGPRYKNALPADLPVLTSRISSKKTWWNKGLIRMLIAPPDPPIDGLWYESRVYATCPNHYRERITPLCGIRQFGLLRRWLIKLKSKCVRGFDLIVPNH